MAAALVQMPVLVQKNSVFAATFKNTPGVSDKIATMHLSNFVMLLVLNFISLAVVFMLTAKITASLCRACSR